MERRRDPVERAEERTGDGSVDLYDVSTWEPRSIGDLVAYTLYNAVSYGFRALVLLIAIAITLVLLVSPAAVVLEDPFVALFFGLSIVPAGLLAAYIWYADITTSEPLWLLVVTFLLAVLFATFAALVNSYSRALLGISGVLFFYLIVGPIEETVKLLAVQVFAYRNDSFNAVIDGAVYGAVAGLGFAAIENALYISRVIGEANPRPTFSSPPAGSRRSVRWPDRATSFTRRSRATTSDWRSSTATTPVRSSSRDCSSPRSSTGRITSQSGSFRGSSPTSSPSATESRSSATSFSTTSRSATTSIARSIAIAGPTSPSRAVSMATRGRN